MSPTATPQPLGERVMLILDETEAKTPGGLVIPEAAREISRWATVAFVGPDCKWLKPGDRVVSSIKGTDLKINDVTYRMVLESTIFLRMGPDEGSPQARVQLGQ